MTQPHQKKNPNCVGKSRIFICLAENQLSLPVDEVGISQMKKFAAVTNLPVIGILQNIKHVIQE
jgi:hypothetical protein